MPWLRNPLFLLIAFPALTLFFLTIAQQLGLDFPAPDKVFANLAIIAKAAPYILLIYTAAISLGHFTNKYLLKLTLITSSLTLQTTLGLAFLLFTIYITATLGILSYLSLLVPLVGLAALAIIPLKPRLKQHFFSPRKNHNYTAYFSLFFAAPIALMLIAAACPPGTLWQVEAFGYDTLSYHLQLPREWLALGQTAPLDHNVYSYLPSLAENFYYAISLLAGNTLQAIYIAQLFHVSLAILTALLLVKTAQSFTSRNIAFIAGAIFLAIPWVMITASLAYNEMFMLVFAAAAITLTFHIPSNTRHAILTTAIIGFFLGLSTLSKLTSGFFFAVPIALMILLQLAPISRLDKSRHTIKRTLSFSIAAALFGLLTLSPYLIRNTIYANNPVFPFATSILGEAHWLQSPQEKLAQRWDQGHGISTSSSPRFEALNRQLFTNRGFGAWGGTSTPVESQNIARFSVEYGLPILPIAFTLAAILALLAPRTRRLTIACLFLLVCQLTFWLTATHLQSRFLLPILLPVCLIIAAGFHQLLTLNNRRFAFLFALAAPLLFTMLITTQLLTLWAQTQKQFIPEQNRTVNLPPYMLVDSYQTDQTNPSHPINKLPENTHVLLVADNASLLYLKPTISYNTAFDPNLLGNIYLEDNGNAKVVTDKLKANGITHVWVHWFEAARLRNTYGFHPALNEPNLRNLARDGHWLPVDATSNYATLYKLP
ncbi:ArnT family glycosyltransferase [Poriferisphaera sp. WC338]|uniref:ArnT family glycosyltransferase n=1 Tax=Poriferisphaera sp. WC338 TaxID=3425129 RepID=UPI003D818F47